METVPKLEPSEILPQLMLDRLNCENKLGDFCLFCLSKVDQLLAPKQSDLLSDNLNVIFLLKNLLKLPNDLLIDNLRKCGSPASWITLCENCSQLTKQAMEHHFQILGLISQLRSIVKIFKDKMKDSEKLYTYQNDMDDKKKCVQEEKLHILNKTREFVINYDYSTQLVNPFIEGDQLARRELEKKESIGLSEDDVGEEISSVFGGDWQEEEEMEEMEEDRKEEQVIEIKEHLVLGIPFSKLPKSRRVHLLGGKWKCRHCDKEFRSFAGACAHEREKHPKVPGQFKCDFCGKRMNSKGYLLTHMYKKHQVNSAGNPINSETLEEPKGPISESEDAKVANEKEEMDTGACSIEKPVVFHFDRKWKCKHCGKGFAKKRSRTSHEKEKCTSAPGQFICDMCGTTWDTRGLLASHQRKVHRINKSGKPAKPRKRKPRKKPEDRSTCDSCGKSFSELGSLTKHVKYFHEKQFDIHCHVCGMGVYSNSILKLHLMSVHKDDPETLKLIEEGMRIWKCEVKGCKGTYWKESGLEEHMRKVHGGGGEGNDVQERFKCSFCGKTFRYWYPFNCHEERHRLGAERPYSCDLCGARLKAKAYLRKHQRRFHPEIISQD